MGQILESLHYEHNDNILDIDLHMLHSWIVVFHTLKLYTVSTLFFHKYLGENVRVIIDFRKFSMFVTTISNVKWASENIGHSQGIGMFM